MERWIDEPNFDNKKTVEDVKEAYNIWCDTLGLCKGRIPQVVLDDNLAFATKKANTAIRRIRKEEKERKWDKLKGKLKRVLVWFCNGLLWELLLELLFKITKIIKKIVEVIF
ncbi:MAG: hypothetical protein J6Z25_02340 [Opitutales bacterium]|nr:hypothetical protein [Opitutales bacterium]